jgi:hypothetical protein
LNLGPGTIYVVPTDGPGAFRVPGEGALRPNTATRLWWDAADDRWLPILSV